jgi:hypothetical protein
MPLKSCYSRSRPQGCVDLESVHWLAVADEIRQGRCNVQSLHLGLLQGASSNATEAVGVVASAIQLDQNLKSLRLRTEDGFADEAGVVLAEALAVHKTLRRIPLYVIRVGNADAAALGAPVSRH